MIKKIFWTFTVLALSSCFALGLGVHFWLPGALKKLIEDKGSSALSGQIRLEAIQLHWGLPFMAELLQVKINKPPQVSLEVPLIGLSLNLKEGISNLRHMSLQVAVQMESPKVLLTSSAPLPHQPEAQSPAGGSLPLAEFSDLRQWVPSIRDLDLKFEIKKGQLSLIRDSVSEIEIQKFDLDLALPTLDQSLTLNGSGVIKIANAMLPFEIPVDFASSLQLKQGALELDKSVVKILNLTTIFQGQVDLARKAIKADMILHAPQLEKIPLPTIQNLPVKSWKGDLDAQLKIQGPFTDPQIQGRATLKDGALMVIFNTEQFHADGLLKADLSVQFVRDQQKSELRFPSLKWALDFQQMGIALPKMFDKPRNVNFSTQGSAQISRLNPPQIQVDDIQVRLAQINLAASGKLQPTASSHLKIEIAPTNLSGLEKIFPPIADYPLRGSLALKAEVEGLLSDPKKLKVNLDSLRLEKVSTALKVKTADLQIEGPVSLDLKGQLQVDQMNVKAGQVSLFSDFSNLRISYKELFKKKPGELLQCQISANKDGNSLALKQSQLRTIQGIINLSGTPPLSAESPMDLSLEIKSLDLGKIGLWVPSMASVIPAGNLKANLKIKGQINSKDFMQSPLLLNGQFAADLPRFALAASAKKDTPPEKAPIPKPAEAFLKDTTFIRNLNLTGTLNLGQFTMDKLSATGLTIQAKIDKAVLVASAQIKKIFDGSINVNQVVVPLTKADPELEFRLKTQGIRLEQVLHSFVPEFASLASGAASVDVQGRSKMPGTPQFLDKIMTEGNLQVSQGTLNTVNLSEILKGLIQKIPGAKPDMLASRGPLQARILANFKMKNGQVELAPLDATTLRKEQLLVRGTANLKMDLDLSGSLFLVDQIISGPFYEANKDASGRLEIPLKIQGNALKPEFKFAQETLTVMIGKTVELEKKRLLNQAEAQVKAEVEKKKSELQNKFTEDLKKKAQDLFKR